MISRITLLLVVLCPLASDAQQVKTEIPDSLARIAKVSESTARKVASAAVPHGTMTSVELEREHGHLQYSYDFDVSSARDITEVHVDAMTGKLLGTEHEAKGPR